MRSNFLNTPPDLIRVHSTRRIYCEERLYFDSPMKAALLLLLALILPACQHRSYPETVHESELLTIERIGEHVYRHVSLLSIPNYGDFPCNGLVYLKEGRAVVVDTPVDEASSAELIAWTCMSTVLADSARSTKMVCGRWQTARRSSWHGQ